MKRSNHHLTDASRAQLDPFGPQPDKRFYYAFEAFEQRLAIVRRLIQGTDALILVVGERGGGKTTLLQRILATTDKPWKPCRVQTAGSIAVSRLARRSRRGSPAAFLLQDTGGTIVLMDDAHRLSRKELRKLLRDILAADPARKIKRMVLFGQPRLGKNLEAVSGGLIDETAVNKVFLPTITEEEAAAFIRHRLAVAGFTGKNPFTPAVVKVLCRNGAGLPGAINEGAARWWVKKGFSTIAPRNESRQKPGRMLRLAGWFAAAAAAALVAGGLWMSADSDRRPAPAPSAGQQVVRVKIPSGDRQLRPRADIASVSPDAALRPARAKTAGPATTASAPQTAAVDSSHSKPVSAPPASPKQPARIHREDWLLAQNPSSYTLQLLGVRNERSLLAFVSDHRLDRSGHAAYYRSRFKGGIWFPLVYGIYPSADEARRAIAGLPEKIRRMSPWIRRMAAVQAEIRKAAGP